MCLKLQLITWYIMIAAIFIINNYRLRRKYWILDTYISLCNPKTFLRIPEPFAINANQALIRGLIKYTLLPATMIFTVTCVWASRVSTSKGIFRTTFRRAPRNKYRIRDLCWNFVRNVIPGYIQQWKCINNIYILLAISDYL